MANRKLSASAGMLFLAWIATANSHAQGPLSSGDAHYSVAYTGRFLGYARAPESQTQGDTSCTAFPNERLSPFTRAMLVLTTAYPDRVLVGMGNNFSPDLFARTFEPLPIAPGTGASPPVFREFKDDFAWNGSSWVPFAHGPYPTIPMDNVGCFFRLAGYTAIVPGKHDFWFGAERLQLLARFLAGDGAAESGPKPVQMLASNIAIVTTQANADPPLPAALRKTGYEVSKDADLPSPVLPYLRQFRVKNWRTYTRQGAKMTPDELAGYRIDLASAEPLAQRMSKAGRSLQLVPVAHVDPGKQPPSKVEVAESIPQSQAWICPARSAGNPYDLYLPPDDHCLELQEVETACQSASPGRLQSVCENRNLDLTRSFDFTTPNPEATFIFKDPGASLQPAMNYGLCTVSVPPASKPYSCATFSVHAPFLQDPGKFGPAVRSRPCLAATPSAQPKGVTVPCDWGFKEAAGGQPAVAVFGVVDPTLEQHVGLLNSAWLNADSSLDTRLEFLAPDQALRQALQECAEDPNCSKARKILLAQMPQPLAAALSGNFPSIFDLTISEPDYEHDTGAESLTREIGTADPQGRKTGFLLTPRPPYEPAAEGDPGHLEPHLAVARLDGTASGQGANWRLEHRVEVLLEPGSQGLAILSSATKYGMSRSPVNDRNAQQKQQRITQYAPYAAQGPPPAPAAGSLNQDVNSVLLSLGAAPPNTGDQAYMDLALLAVQRHFKSDVAILQRRDLFDASKIGQAKTGLSELQDALNRIYWKGDLIIRTHVTGAALKKVYKRSLELDAIDSDGLSTELEKGRGSVFAGFTVSPDDKDAYYVNGALVDDAGLYSVATSDFLGLGDSGYPDLVDGVHAPRMADFRGPQSFLSAVVCREIAIRVHHTPANPIDLMHYCHDDVAGAKYFDLSNARPFDSTAGFTTLRHYQNAVRPNHRTEPVRSAICKGWCNNSPGGR